MESLTRAYTSMRGTLSMMAPMKVCILTETYYPVVGGGETQAKLLAEALIASGHSAMIVTRRSSQRLQKHEQYGAVDVYRLPPTGEGQLKKWGLLFSSFPMLVRLHRSYDLVFVSGFRIIGISAILVSKLFRKKCVLKADSQGEMSGAFFDHGLQKYKRSSSWKPFKFFLSVRNRLLSKADAFSAITSDIVTEFSSAGITTDRIHIIPNAVDTDHFFPVKKEQQEALRVKLGLPSDATLVIYTGRLVSYKGLPLLVKVWHEIYQKHKQAYLLLVGTGGLDVHNCEAELNDYVRTNHLEHCVIFTGSVQNVSEYLQASDIYVLPTENDAFPSALIEAMACALPVVTTPVGAIKSIISDGQNGMLVQPGDGHRLYLALDSLITNSAIARQLGQAALKKVQAAYSTDVVMKQYFSLFQHTLELVNSLPDSPVSET